MAVKPSLAQIVGQALPEMRRLELPASQSGQQEA